MIKHQLSSPLDGHHTPRFAQSQTRKSVAHHASSVLQMGRQQRGEQQWDVLEQYTEGRGQVLVDLVVRANWPMRYVDELYGVWRRHVGILAFLRC